MAVAITPETFESLCGCLGNREVTRGERRCMSTSMHDEGGNEKLLEACARGDAEQVRALLESASVWHRDELGRSPLHMACAAGSLPVVKELLAAGHPWNAVDAAEKSAGEYAKENGHHEVYEFLVEEGVRTELIFGVLQRKEDERFEASNAGYLQQKLVFSNDRLVDAEGNGVMMGWEAPMMKRHAEILCPRPGLDVLNVGFGLGIIDTYLQEHQPATHTIIEAHPDVYARMLAEGWGKKPGVRILFGRWQDVISQLQTYDAIFFDTFGEFYKDMKDWHEELINFLREDGVYSFWNGLAATNPFFHQVSCRMAELDLMSTGLAVEWETMVLEEIDWGAEWRGIQRKYWTLESYNLPIIKFQQ